jgi:hypothetical protein
MVLGCFYWEAWLLRGSKNGIKKKKFEISTPMDFGANLGKLGS